MLQSRCCGALDWTGVAMVEFKLDARDGVAKLMEINGRFWGSLQLADRRGRRFPGDSGGHRNRRTAPSACRRTERASAVGGSGVTSIRS